MDDAGTWQALRARTARRARPRARTATGGLDFVPQTDLGTGPLGEAQAADREIARLFAVRAKALARFAAARPATSDRAQGEPGAMSAARWLARPEVLTPVSEWATPEASIALSRSQPKATAMLEQALTLTQKLPGTLAALEKGMLTPDHLRPLLEHVAPIADARLRAEIEAEVLCWVAARAGKRTITAPAQLGDKVLRVVTRRDARDKAQQAIRALRERGVFRQAERGEGLAGLGVVGTVPEIEALHAALSAYVDALPEHPEDTRSREQKLIDVLLDLVLRPGVNGLPPVQVVLTLVAGVQTVLGGDAPAELAGRVVSAETARQLLHALTGAELGEGALAAVRALAHSDAAGPAATDTDRFVEDSGTEPEDPRMRAALADREADWERRLWAGEFDAPEPLTDTEIQAAAERAAADIDWDLEAELARAQERWRAEFAAGRIVDPDPLEDRTSRPPAEPGPGSRATSGWWAAADRAVDDAGRAVRDARSAVGRAQQLVRTAARADAADETAWTNSAAGRVEAADNALAALAAATEADRQALADLLDRAAGAGLAERPRLALVDALSGTLVSLTDLPGLRRAAHCGRPACRRRPQRCGHDLTGRAGLGAPRPTDGYRPSAELDRFIRHRDRRCRFPGCRRPLSRGEIDHRIAWPHGPTDVTNLAGFCTGDHRGKHQAPGFEVAVTDEGALVVTTPSGITATTEAPPF